MRPPQLAGSRNGCTIGISQSLKQDSYSLLKNGVPEMFLNSSSQAGGQTFGMGVWCSTTHCLGYPAEEVIALKMMETGSESSTAKLFTTYLGRSPGTDELGFLAALIFL